MGYFGRDLKSTESGLRMALLAYLLIFIVLILLAFNVFGEEEIDLGDEYIGFGAMAFVEGNLDLALELFQKALAEDIKKYGENHPRVARDYFNMGTVYMVKGDIQRGKGYYKSVIQICRDKEDSMCQELTRMMEHNLKNLKGKTQSIEWKN